MANEYAEHEEKRNNGANSPFQLGEADRKHIAGIGLDVPCAKRGQKEHGQNGPCSFSVVYNANHQGKQSVACLHRYIQKYRPASASALTFP